MEFSEFLALCRKQGYEGPGTRAGVKAWLDGDDSPEIELYDTKGAKIDIAPILSNKVVVKGVRLDVYKTDGPPDTVEVMDETQAGDSGDAAPTGASAAPKSRVGSNTRAAKGIEAMIASGKAFGIVRPEVAAYKHRIKHRGSVYAERLKERAVFDDVDRAEVAGATLRLEIAACNGRMDYPMKRADLEIVGKTTGAIEGVNTQGGALVRSEEYMPELIVLINEYGAARQLCRVRPMSGPPLAFPRRTADPTVSWEAEGGTSTAQSPAYDNVTVTPKKLQGLMPLSSELLNDSAISVVDDIFNGFANAIANKEDNAFFAGDGTSTYGGVTGFLNAIGSAGVFTQASGNTWAATTDSDLQGTLALVPSYAWAGNNVKITCTPSAFYSIINRVSRGIGGVSYIESQTGVVRPVYNGYPIVYNNIMASATAVSTISLFVGDFDMAAKFGEVRGSVEFATSEHFYFSQDMLALRARERVGITVHDAGDSSNAGPVVGYKTGS